MTYYVIDRIEGALAVIVGDDGRTFDVAWARLPQARETLRRLAESDPGGDITL